MQPLAHQARPVRAPVEPEGHERGADQHRAGQRRAPRRPIEPQAEQRQPRQAEPEGHRRPVLKHEADDVGRAALVGVDRGILGVGEVEPQRHEGVRQRLEAAADPLSRGADRSVVRQDQVLHEGALIEHPRVQRTPGGEHRRHGNGQGQHGGEPPGAPERQQPNEGNAEQRDGVNQVAQGQRHPRPSRAPLPGRVGSPERHGRRQQLGPGEGHFVGNEGGEHQQRERMGRGARAPHRSREPPDRKDRAAGHHHHRQPVGGEPAVIERLPRIVWEERHDARAGGEDDRHRRHARQRPAVAEVVRGVQEHGLRAVAVGAQHRELGHVVRDARVRAVADLEGAGQGSAVELAHRAERPGGLAQPEQAQGAEGEQRGALIGLHRQHPRRTHGELRGQHGEQHREGHRRDVVHCERVVRLPHSEAGQDQRGEARHWHGPKRQGPVAAQHQARADEHREQQAEAGEEAQQRHRLGSGVG